jgi:hypothetical protein
MRLIAPGLALLLASGLGFAQMPTFPDAASTDPARLGIMKGSPPSADKVVRWARAIA